MKNITEAEVISALSNFKKEVLDMDLKVKKFLADRKTVVNPNFQGLVDRIRKFENSIHNRRFGFANTEIHMRLDSLLHMILVHHRYWVRLFDEDGIGIGVVRKQIQDAGKPEQTKLTDKESKAVDKFYKLSKEKWENLDIDASESRDEMANRLMPQYNEAQKNLKPGQKVTFVYDSKTHKIQVKVRGK